MPGPMTNEQLRAWYKDFSALLLKEADIDVRTPHSLGLVKNFEITRWETVNADKPDIKISYAYTDASAVPFSDTASKTVHEQWMKDNLKPAVTEDQIRRLYNMSREGTLMLSSPTSGIKDIRMVHTDPSGKISLSQPISTYREENQIPEMPDKATSSLKPEDYGIRPRPTEPQAPANMNPGFWSWLGYKLFGMDTDAAKLERYEKAMEAYLKEAFQWELDVFEKASGNEVNAETGEATHARYDEYRQARAEHDQHIAPLDAFMSNPIGKFSVLANYAEKRADEQFWKNESNSVSYAHQTSPRGTALEAVQRIKNTLHYAERTDIWLHNWWGHDADPTKVQEHFTFTTGEFHVKPLELPKCPGFDQMTQDQQAIQSKYMSDLFDMTVLSAIADPEITGKDPKPGRTNIDQARNRFGHILNDMITSGRSDVKEYLVHVDPAREKAMNAMEAYAKGEKGPLAEVLARGMRELLLAGHNLKLFTNHAYDTAYVIGKMYNLLQQDKDLLQATGLKENELQDAQAYIELHQIMRQGHQSKMDILEHALGHRTLSSDELAKAAGDVLLFNHVMLGLKDCYTKNETLVCSTEEYRRLEESYYVLVDPNDPSKGRTSVDSATADKINHQIEALVEVLPPNDCVLGLLNKDGVKQYRDSLMEKANLSKIGEMSRDELRDIFSKLDSEKITSSLMSPPKQEQQSKQAELSNNEPKHQAQGVLPGMK